MSEQTLKRVDFFSDWREREKRERKENEECSLLIKGRLISSVCDRERDREKLGREFFLCKRFITSSGNRECLLKG